MDAKPNTALAQRLMWVVWPAFLVAIALEVLVFAMIDPETLHGFGGAPLEASRTTVYSVAFFVFWLAAAASSALTTLLARSPFELNRCPLTPDARPAGCPKQDLPARAAGPAR